ADFDWPDASAGPRRQYRLHNSSTDLVCGDLSADDFDAADGRNLRLAADRGAAEPVAAAYRPGRNGLAFIVASGDRHGGDCPLCRRVPDLGVELGTGAAGTCRPS